MKFARIAILTLLISAFGFGCGPKGDDGSEIKPNKPPVGAPPVDGAGVDSAKGAGSPIGSPGTNPPPPMPSGK